MTAPLSHKICLSYGLLDAEPYHLFCLFYQVEIRYRQLPPERTACPIVGADMRGSQVRFLIRVRPHHLNASEQLGHRTLKSELVYC
jgi:hypothetical protein